MRFFRDFDNFQILKWSNHYVQYQSLRTSIRNASPEVANANLKDDQRRVVAFHSRLTNVLNVRADGLVRYSLIPKAFNGEVHTASHLSCTERENALQALAELLEDVKELHWFEYVNEQAFRLLRGKLERKFAREDVQTGENGAEDMSSIFFSKVDRIRLLKWVEHAIKFVTIDTPQTTSQLVTSLLTTNQLASFSPDCAEQKARVHLLIQEVGRNAAKGLANNLSSIFSSNIPIKHGINSDEELSQLLDRTGPFPNSAFQGLDEFKRLPLHYAAQYGLMETTKTILGRMKLPSMLEFQGHDLLSYVDSLGQTPLHVSLLKGYTSLFGLLLDASTRTGLLNTDLLILALRMNASNSVNRLIDLGVGMDSHDTEGRGVLHIAARSGQDQHLCDLLLLMDNSKIDEIDKSGLSALTYASMYGHSSTVQLLLKNGADPCRQDLRGWTAKDYAAHKGFIDIAMSLNAVGSRSLAAGMQRNTTYGEKQMHQKSEASKPHSHQGEMRGKRALSSSTEHTVIIHMGSLDYRKASPDLKLVSGSDNLGLAIEITARGSLVQSPREIVSLPILENSVNRPYVVSTRDLTSLQIVFGVLDVEDLGQSDLQRKEFGTAVALVHALRCNSGDNRESLVREATVPVLGERYQLLGMLTFWFLIRVDGRPKLIGHRGNGQNAHVQERPRVQLGENTLQSFLSAHNLGVSIVEFDVQVTADLVPIAYHDYSVSETGTDVPVHILTLDQVQHISRAQQSIVIRECMTEKRYESGLRTARKQRARALSVEVYDERHTADIADRVNQTFHFRRMGLKPNIRGHHVQEPINTLEELLKKLPKTLGFDIELKYPMFWEPEEWHMPAFSTEINTFIDSILELCFTYGGEREIVLSSFCPEACIALKLKQNIYPVVFLSEAGVSPAGDVRTISFQEALHFSRRWDLDGVAPVAEPFILSRKLVEYATSEGFFTITYGGLNNNCEYAAAQVDYGVDSLVVDDILRVSRSLEQHFQDQRQS